MLYIIRLFLVIFSLVFFAKDGFSYSINAFTGMSQERDFIVAGIFKGMKKSELVYEDLSLSYGATSAVDITGYVSFYQDFMNRKNDLNQLFFMPRLELTRNHILALQVLYDNAFSQSFIYSAQYHAIYDPEKSHFAFISNLGINIPAKDTLDSLNIFGIFTPAFKISDSFCVYLEIDPFYQFSGEAKGLSLDLLPGFWMGFNKNQYQLSAALILKKLINSTHEEIDYGAGLFVSVTFEKERAGLKKSTSPSV